MIIESGDLTLDPSTWAGATGSDRWLTDLEASKHLAVPRAAEYATTHQVPIRYS